MGLNRRGKVLWATTARVHRYEPGRAIGWTVRENRTRWSYEVQPDGTGSRLEQRREADATSPLAAWFAATFLGGRQVHDDELEQGMRDGLDRIRRIVEHR